MRNASLNLFFKIWMMKYEDLQSPCESLASEKMSLPSTDSQ